LLATTDPQKLPVTVLSRCLQFNLKRMSRSQILSQLKYLTEQEEVEADAAALVQLASAADGSMRDALSLLDQAIGYGAGAVRQQAVEAMLGSISRDYLKRLLDALAQRQATSLLTEARGVIEHNPDYQRVCAEMISLLQQVALYQADPQLVVEDEFGEELLQGYARCWSPEEVQLYYQILLQGRQDLLISADEAAGFEMLMLRLIAFSPALELADDAGEVKKKPELRPPGPVPQAEGPESASAALHGLSAQPPQVGASEVKAPAGEAVEAVAPAVEMIASDPPAATELCAPTSAVELSAAEKAPAGSSASGDAGFDWLTMAYELGLSGMAQELVANSELVSRTNDAIELRLPSELHELVNELTRAEILQALRQKLGVSLDLRLSAVEKLRGTTPLQAKLERQHNERIAAIAAIRDEAMVKKLQHAFAAELDEASVVKIDGKATDSKEVTG
jgi:DNA polymerase-3 subunit gamma/tau